MWNQGCSLIIPPSYERVSCLSSKKRTETRVSCSKAMIEAVEFTGALVLAKQPFYTKYLNDEVHISIYIHSYTSTIKVTL